MYRNAAAIEVFTFRFISFFPFSVRRLPFFTHTMMRTNEKQSTENANTEGWRYMELCNSRIAGIARIENEAPLLFTQTYTRCPSPSFPTPSRASRSRLNTFGWKFKICVTNPKNFFAAIWIIFPLRHISSDIKCSLPNRSGKGGIRIPTWFAKH